jgi:hypothetical protein
MVRAGLTAVFTAFFSVAAHAQQPTTVSGTVLDARTGQPLRDVVVSFADPAVFATSDANGRFEVMVVPGTYEVTLALVGYALYRQAVTITPGDNPQLIIHLSEGAGQFEERITVTGNSADRSGVAPAGVSVYGRDLQALRGVTLDDPLRAIHALPSVAATDDFYSEFAVRGSSFRHVGLIVDGVPSRYMMHAVYGVPDGGSITMINSDAVGSLSLLPGSYPQQWGRHVGAQMSVDLREGDREKFRGRAGLSGTSATMLAEGPLASGRGSWLMSARRSYLDLVLRRIDPENTLAFGFTDAEGKAVMDLTPRHRLEALLIAGGSKFTERPENLAANDEAEVKGQAWLSALTWRFTPSARFSLTQKGFVTGLRFRNHNRDNAVLDSASSSELGWRTDASAALSPRLIINFGADAQRLSGRHRENRALNDAIELTTIADYTHTGTAFSSYVQGVLVIGSRLTLAPGLRTDYWGLTTASTSSPWAMVDVEVTRTTHLRAATGVYRQFADFEQIAGLHAGGDRLRPETADHVDVGLSQRLPLDLNLQITGYLRNEHDILFTPGAEPRLRPEGVIELGRGRAPWVNALTGKARGVEVVLRRDSPSRLSGWAGYAFGRDRYVNTVTAESFWADYDQRHAVSLFAHYRLSNRSTIGAKFRYGTNYPLVGYIGLRSFTPDAPPLFGGTRPLFYGLVQTRNTLRLPAYSRLDVRADRTFTWSARRRMTLFVELANALNHQNLRNVPYGVDRTGRVQEPTDTLLPIVPSAGMVIEF